MKRNRLSLLFLAAAVALPVMTAAAQQPADCDANTNYLEQGRVAFAAADYGSAINAYDCAIALNPTDPQPYLLQSYPVLLQGDFAACAVTLVNYARDRDTEALAALNAEADSAG
ncbi:MAG: hypothetical protein HC828_16140, partial [Blastochloris sp.]|nr:hypothetical protein [Blastochloris sp.]